MRKKALIAFTTATYILQSAMRPADKAADA
jgi:hypothetical protein